MQMIHDRSMICVKCTLVSNVWLQDLTQSLNSLSNGFFHSTLHSRVLLGAIEGLFDPLTSMSHGISQAMCKLA